MLELLFVNLTFRFGQKQTICQYEITLFIIISHSWVWLVVVRSEIYPGKCWSCQEGVCQSLHMAGQKKQTEKTCLRLFLGWNSSCFLCYVTTSPDSCFVGFPAGEPVSGTPARWPAVEALRYAEWSASPRTPRAPAWWRMPLVPPTPRHRLLCRPATCTSAPSIVRVDGARWVYWQDWRNKVIH